MLAAGDDAAAAQGLARRTAVDREPRAARAVDKISFLTREDPDTLPTRTLLLFARVLFLANLGRGVWGACKRVGLASALSHLSNAPPCP